MTLPLKGKSLMSFMGSMIELKLDPHLQVTHFCRKAEVGAIQEGVEVLLNPINLTDPNADKNITIMRGLSTGEVTGWEEVTNLEDYRVLPRSSVGASKPLIAKIRGLGGISELSESDINGVVDWPTMLSEEFTQRRMTTVPYRDVAKVVEEYGLEGNVFIKTLHKQVSGQGIVVSIDELLGHLENGRMPYNAADTAGNGEKQDFKIQDHSIGVVVSQPVDFLRSSSNIFSNEYRSFVANSNIAHMFTYPIAELEKVPKDAKRFVEHFIKSNESSLPENYVVDVGLLTNGSYCVVELNPFVYSAGLSRKGTRRVLRTFGYSKPVASKFGSILYADDARRVDKLST